MSEWISVEDRLPEFVGEYITFDGISPYISSYYGNGEWESPDANDPNITHWMPLPEPPKGESDE